MRELRLIPLAYLVLAVLSDSLSQTKSEDSISKHPESDEQVVNMRLKRSNFHRQHEKGKKYKLKAAVEKRSSQQKRQYVPLSLFHSHPHLHRIIVHHHSGEFG